MTDTPLVSPEYAPRPTDSPFRIRGVWLVLVTLTLLAGVLRFSALDRPTIWGDEAATAGRVIGSYQELLDQLADGSFTPLHYQAVWWIAQGMPYWGEVTTDDNSQKKTFTPTERIVEGGIRMTPFYMRLIPAIAGTLMVPAIYFLSRQLFGPHVSLLAAGLACVSAYLLIYSRDAKMYMPFWLLCTLNVACLMWWLRVRSLTAWLCWVIAGAAMMGYHALGTWVLVINVLIALTAPRQHWSGWWKLGAIVAYPFVLIVTGLYELLRKRFDLMVWWRFREVARYPKRLYPAFHFPTLLLVAIGLYVIVAPTQHYFASFNNKTGEVVSDDGEFNTGANGTSWVERYNRGRDLGSLTLYTASAYLTGWEWPRTAEWGGEDDQAQVNPRTLKLLKASVVVLLGLFMIGMLPWRRIFSPVRARLDRIAQDGTVDKRFVAKRTLWISVWLIVPAFAMYTQSVDRPAFVLDAVSQIAIKDPANIDWPRLPRTGAAEAWSFYTDSQNLRPFASAFAKSWQAYVAQFTPESLATARLIVLAVAAGLVVAAIVWRRRTLSASSMRLLFAAVVVVLLCAVLSLAPRFADRSVWMPRYVGVVVPAFLVLCAVLILRLPTWWLRSLAIALFVVINLSQYTARVFTPSEPPSDRIAADILAASPADESTVRTYVSMRHRGAEPGMGTYPSGPTAYYLWLETRLPDVPAISVRHGSYPSGRIRIFEQVEPSAIARNLERTQRIDRVIVWTSYDWNAVDTTDPIADALRGRFRRVSDDCIPAYDHWRWMKLYNLRRSEYVRIG
jgi:hypothetical protein